MREVLKAAHLWAAPPAGYSDSLASVLHGVGLLWPRPRGVTCGEENRPWTPSVLGALRSLLSTSGWFCSLLSSTDFSRGSDVVLEGSA